jgi:DNA-binding CsgD family transcriptional regulator
MMLLERDSHLEGLTDWLAGVPASGGRIALVTGEAGIGKTALLTRFAELQRGKARVLWGGCEALFTPHPLAPLYDIARQAGGDFPRILAEAIRRELVFNAALDHLSIKNQPTIVIIEDAHWGDAATLDFVKFLGRRLQRLNVLLVISYRDDEVNPKHPLCSVIGDLPAAFTRRFQLHPLSADAVAALAVAAGRSPEGVLDLACGNPFFVTEVLASADQSLPVTILDAVSARMARISDDARRVANAAALVPGRIEPWLLAAVVPEARAAIQECLGIGMIAPPEGGLAYRHELARRAVEEQLSAPQRQDLHGRILQALLARAVGDEVPMARLVHHADGAGDSAAVLRVAPLAAERAAALGAHREAAAHYECALRHADHLPSDSRADLNERLSYECYLTDHIAEAIAARKIALALRAAAGDQLKEGDNHRWLSRLSWFSGNYAVAEEHAKHAIRILEALPPSNQLAMAYSNCAQLYMLHDYHDRTLIWGRKAIALATTLGNVEVLSHAFNNVGTAKAMYRDRGGYHDLERSLALALENGLEEHAARAYTNLGSTGVRLYDLAIAGLYLNDGIAYCEERDLDSWARYMKACRATHALLEGRWTDAADDAQGLIRHPRLAPVTRIPALVALGLVRARRGDPEVDTVLQEALDLARPTEEHQRISAVLCARAEAAWLRGAAQSALAEMQQGVEQVCAISNPWIQGELALWLWRCGGMPHNLKDLPAPFRLQITGDWRGAAAAWEMVGCPYEQAMALSDGDDPEQLRRALGIFERLEAAPMAGAVRRKLRAGGIRGIARGPQERTRRNPHGLTPKELKVLALLVEGRRNADIAGRLFVSEKTVDHHVSAILGKLEVRSRGEAAAAANRLRLLENANGEMAREAGREAGAKK